MLNALQGVRPPSKLPGRAAQVSAGAPLPSYQVCLSNLPDTITDASLYAWCQSALSRWLVTDLEGVNVACDPRTRVPRGYAFARFQRDQSAVMATRHLQGLALDGRPLTVKRARHKEASSWIRDGDQASVSIRNFGNGLPLKEEWVRAVFGPFGEITEIRIPASCDFAYVNYVEYASALAAVTLMDAFKFPGEGGFLRVEWCCDPDSLYECDHHSVPGPNLALSAQLETRAPCSRAQRQSAGKVQRAAEWLGKGPAISQQGCMDPSLASASSAAAWLDMSTEALVATERKDPAQTPVRRPPPPSAREVGTDSKRGARIAGVCNSSVLMPARTPAPGAREPWADSSSEAALGGQVKSSATGGQFTSSATVPFQHTSALGAHEAPSDSSTTAVFAGQCKPSRPMPVEHIPAQGVRQSGSDRVAVGRRKPSALMYLQHVRAPGASEVGIGSSRDEAVVAECKASAMMLTQHTSVPPDPAVMQRSRPFLVKRGEYEFCKICNTFVTDEHLMSRAHRRRLDMHEEYLRAKEDRHPPAEWGEPQYYEWREGWGWWCRLCAQWADEGHVDGQKHRKRVEYDECYGGGGAYIAWREAAAEEEEQNVWENTAWITKIDVNNDAESAHASESDNPWAVMTSSSKSTADPWGPLWQETGGKPVAAEDVGVSKLGISSQEGPQGEDELPVEWA